jgi:hypothetical protein
MLSWKSGPPIGAGSRGISEVGASATSVRGCTICPPPRDFDGGGQNHDALNSAEAGKLHMPRGRDSCDTSDHLVTSRSP